ncbi:MAG: MarR family winged helix-turn-helix transcriptional regulator [Candidatus Dormibacteria bacterium]
MVVIDEQQVGRLRMAVMRLSRRLRQQGNIGITASQLAVLGTLSRRGVMTPGQLAEAESVQPPSMTRIIAGLVDSGMVLREARDDDRRSAEVTLSARGRRAVDSIRAHRNTWLTQRLELLNDAEREDLWRGVAAMEKLLEGPR